MGFALIIPRVTKRAHNYIANRSDDLITTRHVPEVTLMGYCEYNRAAHLRRAGYGRLNFSRNPRVGITSPFRLSLV